jgi:hypothetical protein
LKIHTLKVWPAYYDRLADGSKTFEVRRDDRGYQTGDLLVLREWDPEKCRRGTCRDPDCPAYTGREMRRHVGFVFKAGFGVDLGQHAVLSLLPDGEAS